MISKLISLRNYRRHRIAPVAVKKTIATRWASSSDALLKMLAILAALIAAYEYLTYRQVIQVFETASIRVDQQISLKTDFISRGKRDGECIYSFNVVVDIKNESKATLQIAGLRNGIAFGKLSPNYLDAPSLKELNYPGGPVSWGDENFIVRLDANASPEVRTKQAELGRAQQMKSFHTVPTIMGERTITLSHMYLMTVPADGIWIYYESVYLARPVGSSSADIATSARIEFFRPSAGTCAKL